MKAGKLLLDTSVVVEHLRNTSSVTEVLLSSEGLFLPWIGLGELHYGASKSESPAQKLAALQSFLKSVFMLWPTEETCAQYGSMRAELQKQGTPIPDNDIWIAAIARERNLTLYTKDRHFEKISELKLIVQRSI